MADFNQDNPPLRITNPDADKAGLGKGFQPYPAHMHKLGTAPDGGPLYIVVHNDEEREKAAEAGWSDRPDGADEPTGVHPSRANVSELLAEIERLRAQLNESPGAGAIAGGSSLILPPDLTPKKK